MDSKVFEYTGRELELFAAAKNWKRYYSSILKPFIKGDVLEAGAGTGTNTNHLFTDAVKSWTLLEPDDRFAFLLNKKIEEKKLPQMCSVYNGFTQQLAKKFDCIIYTDVMEHIADDRKEMATAAALLNSNGTLIVLSPAHNFLMSEFDTAIGHHRRYSKKTLLALADESLVAEKAIYLDSIGLAASLANRFLLKQQYPTTKQIDFWDSYIIPVSKIADKLLLHSIGKTIVVIWKKK